MASLRYLPIESDLRKEATMTVKIAILAAEEDRGLVHISKFVPS